MFRSVGPRRRCSHRDEDGFTVLEVTVAIALVTIVMTSLAAFFVNTGNVTELQGERQTAVQLATDAAEQARSLTSIGLMAQRDKATSEALWSAGRTDTANFPDVASRLPSDKGTLAYDTSTLPTNSGLSAPLPVCLPSTPVATCKSSGATVTRNNKIFTRNWFLNYCVRSSSNGQCTPAAKSTTASQYINVQIVVTWRDKDCDGAVCSYATGTLVSPTPDPFFDASQTSTKPKIVNPGPQSTKAGVTITPLVLKASGGTDPFTWEPPTNLPAGLSFSTDPINCDDGGPCIYGTPTTVAGAVTIPLKVTDVFGYVSTSTFTWTVTSPTLDAIATETSVVGTADSLTPTTTGGVGPFNWVASSLPPGVTINAATGKMSGTPTTAGTFTPTVRFYDSKGNTDAESFSWVVRIGIEVSDVSCGTPDANNYYTCVATFTASGGTGKHTWGDSVNGKTNVGITVQTDTKIMKVKYFPVTKGTYTLTVTVTDGSKNTGTTTTTWKAGT